MVLITEPELLIQQPPSFRRTSVRSSKDASVTASRKNYVRVNMGVQPTAKRAQTSFPLAPCGEDFFWTSCWDNGNKSPNKGAAKSKTAVAPPKAKKAQESLETLNMAGVNFQSSATDDDSFGKLAKFATSVLGGTSQYPRTPQHARKSNKRVSFSDHIDYRDPEEALDDEERALYFWSESDTRRLKEERRLLLTRFRNMVHFSGAPFWDDDSVDSIRGLEDHIAELLGVTNSYFVRREHERRVLSKFLEQYVCDPGSLRETSRRSSVKSTLRALEKAETDAANAQETDFYECQASTSIWDDDKNSDFSDA